eukprot:11212231-Lingulodinium_polyedra.AAC.1
MNSHRLRLRQWPRDHLRMQNRLAEKAIPIGETLMWADGSQRSMSILGACILPFWLNASERQGTPTTSHYARHSST